MSLNADVSSSWNGDFITFRANISSIVFHCFSKWCEVSSLWTSPSTSSLPLLNRFPMASTIWCSVSFSLDWFSTRPGPIPRPIPMRPGPVPRPGPIPRPIPPWPRPGLTVLLHVGQMSMPSSSCFPQ